MTTQDIDLGVVARGPKGDKGDKGDTGPVGPQGPANVKLAESDTRSANNAPSWYLSNYGESIITEFKQTATIGVSSILTGTYCNLTTIVSWHDASGGLPVQIATSNDNSGRFAYRVATSTSAWGAWQQMGAQGPKGDTGAQGPQGIQGPKGEQGNVGPAPTLKIGTVTKLGPDQTPTANLSGGNGSYTLNMGIPQGETNATATQALDIANSVSAKVDGIKIGGRNYLRDSDKSTYGWAQDLGTMPNEVLNSLAGETITVSVDTEWSDYQHSDSKQNRLGFELAVNGSDGKSYWLGAWKGPETPSGKERVSTTFTLPANVTFTVNNNGHNGYVSINGTGKVSHAQVEIGNVSKDWQPAPEDIQTQIDANKTTANNAQNTANTAKSTADSALSKANSNATALNNKANKSDLTWANISGKPSIPNADDTTTVSSGDLNNYTTTGKYYMPNALANYTNHPTTGIDMGNWFVMKVDAYHGADGEDMIVQTIYQINTGDVWIRHWWENSWRSWRQINFWS